MIIIYFLKITIHSLSSLNVIFIPFLLYSPQQEIAGTPDRPNDCKYILSLDHVMVFKDIDDFFLLRHPDHFVL